MATRTTVAIQDDLAGGPADQTVQFGLDGADYEIDLNAENAADFRRQLAPFLDHARIASARQRRPARTVASRLRSSRIRAWARDQGIQVSDRGRLPASVTKRYEGVSSGMLTSAGDLPGPDGSPRPGRARARDRGSGPSGRRPRASQLEGLFAAGLLLLAERGGRACRPLSPAEMTSL